LFATTLRDIEGLLVDVAHHCRSTEVSGRRCGAWSTERSARWCCPLIDFGDDAADTAA
jgi:hypothetical protein